MLATFTDYTYKALLDSAPDAMVIVNDAGKIELVNIQTERMFGYNREELVGQNVEVLIPARFKNSHKKKRNGFIASPEMREMGGGMELYAIRKDGSEFLVEIALSYLKTGDDTSVCAAIRDISEKKAAENKFKDLLESAPDAMVIADERGKIELVNAQTEKLFGYRREELIGNEVEVLIPFRYRLGHYDKKVTFIASPEVREMGSGLELFALRKDGSEFLVEIALSYLKSGKKTNVCAAIRDISERKLLERQKAQLASIVEFSNDAIIGINADRIITTWNIGAEAIFGYQPVEIKGKHAYVLVPADKLQEVDQITTKILNGEVTFHLETEMMRKNGDRFPVSVTCSPVKDGHGTITGISQIVRDITQLRADRQKIWELNRDKHFLEEKLQYHKQVEDFAYITSHNLRSPVGNLSALFMMYDQQTSSEGKENIVNKLRNVSQHLNNTLHELSKALSIKTDTSIEKELVSFSTIFKIITESIEADIDRTEAKISADFSECPEIIYPRVYLESIMLNFLTNALKYRSPQRSPQVIFKTLKTKDEGIVLKVTDNGIGLDLKRHGKKLFGLHKTFHRNKDAKGVGLFITRAQVEAMGGKISVESEVGKGSTFIVHFAPPADTKDKKEQP